jgi:hypothetical protein
MEIRIINILKELIMQMQLKCVGIDKYAIIKDYAELIIQIITENKIYITPQTNEKTNRENE